MAKMQGSPLLILLSVMIVLSHFMVAGWDWRFLRRPSEVYRHKGSLFRQSCNDNDQDAAQQDAAAQEEMTFSEFMKLRDSMRMERWRHKILSSPDEESEAQQERWAREEVASKNTAGSDDSPDTTEETKPSKVKQKGLKSRTVLKCPKPVQAHEDIFLPSLKAKCPKPVSEHGDVFLPKLRAKSQQPPEASKDVILLNDQPVIALPSVTQVETAEQNPNSEHVKIRDAEGHNAEASPPSPSSPQEVPADGSTDSDPSVRSPDKTCVECSPIWYHILTAIVPAVWLTNIALVAWICFARDTKQNMRIPRGLVHKSSQTSTRLKNSAPQSVVHEKGRRLHGDNSTAVTTLVSGISPSQSYSTFDTSRKDSLGHLPGRPEPNQRKNDSEFRKNKRMLSERSTGDHTHASDASRLRSHVESRQSLGQKNLAIIADKSQEDRVRKQGLNNYQRETHRKNERGIFSDQKVYDAGNEHPLNEDNTPVGRGNYPTPVHGADRNLEATFFKARLDSPANNDMEKSRCNADYIDENVYIKPETVNEAEGKYCSRNPGEPPAILLDNKKLAEGSLIKGTWRIESQSQCQDVATQKSGCFDAFTQMSSVDLYKSCSSVNPKPLCFAQQRDAPGFVDSATSPLTLGVISNPKSTGDAGISEQYECTNTISCEYGAAGTGDHFGKPEGYQQKPCAVHPLRKASDNPMGIRGKSQDDVHTDGRCNNQTGVQPGAKGDEQGHYKADSFIFEGESLMPPPPFGYHVRRDFSNPESSTNLCKVMQFDSVGNDLNATRMLNTNDLFASRQAISTYDTEDSTSSSGMWKSLVTKQPPVRDVVPTGREHSGDTRQDTERKKRPKKLMIIGKVNCTNLSRQRKTGKQDSRTPLEIVREHEYQMFDKRNELKRERKRDSAKMIHAYPIVVKSAKKPSAADGKSTDNPSTQTTKLSTAPSSFRSLDDGSQQYYKVLEYADKHTPHLYMKRNARHRNSMKLNGGINIKRLNVKRESGVVRKSAKRLTKTSESRSCFDVVLESNHNSEDRRQKLPSQNTAQLDLLPSYYMNLNCNAGVSDQAGEGVAGGKTQAELASAENAHNIDLYNSSDIDTEVHTVHSEMDSNVSPLFANDGDDVVTVVSLGTSEPLVDVSRSSDQLKPSRQGPEGEKQQKVNSFNDADREQRSREQNLSEKMVDFRGDNHFSRSTASLAARDAHVNGANCSRHKKKTKTTETALIKQENSISKKISGTVASKEVRKLVINRTRQNKLKQQVTAGDVHKSVAGSVEKGSKTATETQRLGKTGKCSEAYSETADTKMKGKLGCETYMDYIVYKESQHHGRGTSNGQSQEVRSAESDHHYSPPGICPSKSPKSEDVSQMKRLVSLPETMPSQGSPKRSSLSGHYQHKPDVVGKSSSTEVKSPVVIRASVSSATPVSLKQEATCSSSARLDIVGKRETVKRIDSPKKDFTDSPHKEKSMSPKKDLSSLRENIEDIEKTPTTEQVSTVDGGENMEASIICPEAKLLVESPTASHFTDWLKNNVPKTRDSPSLKPVDIALKYRNKKSSNENGKGVPTKDDRGESSNGKLGAHATLSSKKKNMSRFKTHSRSPDGKRKRRNLKRCTYEAEDVKTDKLKKIKNGDKLTDKKRKKKKSKSKSVEDLEETPQTSGTTEHLVYKSRSRSNECNIITETTLCSVPTTKLLDAATSEPGLSIFHNSKRKQESRSASSTGRLISSDQVIQSFNRQRVFKYEELKTKSQTTSSAESTSSMSGSNMPTMSAESLLPYPATTIKAPARAVQLVPCPKIRKNEKDLQEAELGWNSTFSSDDKGVAEKVKQNQKRAMVRYYIVKPKPKQTEKEVGVSKLKRPAPRINHPEVEVAGSASDVDLNSEVIPQERVKPGQGKSVQFSDNIEDLEASKEEASIDRPLRRPDSDSILHHPLTKVIIESSKIPGKPGDLEPPVTTKAVPPKKEEQRSPVMAPRKRRPIWLKKSVKDKAGTGVVKPSETIKSLTIGVPVKKLHSSDNMLKASSRFNLHDYYPGKATVGSPKLSNTSLTDKRKVTYKTWINSIFMAAPMNKATKKVVAKSGSPVDIKEIIEGSSVDAVDHFKISKPLHDGDVRPARSVPSLALAKSVGVDTTSGKKHKSSDDSRLGSHKKSKDKPRECWSPRSHLSAEAKEHQDASMKNCLGVVDGPTSPASSTNVDFVAVFKQKHGMCRAGDSGNRRRKDKKGGKKALRESSAKWQGLAAHEARKVSDLEHAHFCGDMVELNVLNMGLSWVVQSVFNRIPFLNQRQQDSTSISTRELATDQQVIE